MAETHGQIAILGLGRMGKGIAKRLVAGGFSTVVWNRSKEPRQALAKEGAIAVDHVKAALNALEKPRIVWSMLPSGQVTEEVLLGDEGLINLLQAGDIMIDGGNANYHDSVRRAQIFAEKGIHYLDIGTSGGLVGQSEGYCLMVGGPREAFHKIEPMLKVIAQEDGYGYIGPSGSGHFVKMVHNAIEYGMMQAFGEGLDLIQSGPYKDIDLKKLLNIWNHGSIVESFLARTIEKEMEADPTLEAYSGEVGYTGEGRWAIDEALAFGVPFTVITESLFARYHSTKNKTFANKVVAAMRHGFGGHTNKERS